MGIGDRGLGLVVCSSHSSVGVRVEHLDLLARLAFQDLDTLTRATGTALALARTAGTHTRFSQQVLGTLGATFGRRHRAFQLGDATLHGAHALRGIQQRLVDATGSLRRALLHGGTRDAGRATARTGAVGLQAGGAHGGVERPVERALGGVGRGPDPSRYRSTRHSWARQRASEGFQSAEHGGSPKRTFHSRIFSMIVSRVQRVTRRPPAVFADGGIVSSVR